MDLIEAIGHAKRGNALLFTGAGFSFGAKNSLPPPDNNVPDARSFAKSLALKLGSTAEFPLQIVSQAYIKREGEHGLVRELLNHFVITSIEQHHKIIAALPWLRVYTTNYDNCFEFAALQTNRNWTPKTTDALITGEKEICVHVNGHISNLTTTSLSNQVKLTHTSYSADSFATSKWSQQLRQDANSAKAVIFIGYSMSDLDIARVFFSSPDLFERTFFIVSPTDDDIVIAPLEAYGAVHKIGIAEFATKVSSTIVTADQGPHQYTWLRRYKPTTRSSPDLAAVIIASFLVTRMGHSPNPDLLSDLLNKDVWRLMKTEEFKAAAEFVRFQHGSIAIRSSIIAEYLLRNAIKPEILIWHIEKVVRRLAEMSRSNTLHHVFTELLRFPMLERIIVSSKPQSRERAKEIIIGFYQSVSELPYCQRNALFWLHYAMARLEYGEFRISGLYFEQAKKFAEGKVGETRDVNNHFARLLLDSRIRSDEYSDHFEAFEKAHSILLDQMNKDTNRHYPYRQALKYVDFIAHRKASLQPAEVEAFKVACRQVKSAIANIRGPLGGAPEVVKCSRYMDRALEIASL